MSREITLDELRAEYERLGLAKEDDGLTVHEFGHRWGLHVSAVRCRLRVAKAAGILRVGRKRVETLNGVMAWAPCYTLDVGSKAPSKPQTNQTKQSKRR